MSLFEALRARDLPELQKVLAATSFDLNRAYEGELPLVFAVGAGPGFVAALLAAGADVNGRAENDTTALIEATDQAALPVLQTLLAAGANPNLLQRNVVSPLHAAARTRSRGHLEALRVLITAKANVNVQSRSEAGIVTNTPLFAACEAGNLEAVRELLAGGADVNAPVFFGTPLTAAAENGHEEIAKLLLQAGADPEARLPEDPVRLGKSAGKSALELAQQKKRKRIVALLAPTQPSAPPARSASVLQAWQRLETTLERLRPPLRQSLRPGATPESLARLAGVGEPGLPVELEEYFKRHDGQSGGARAKFIRTPSPEGTRFRLLRIEEVVREWRVWNELLVAGEFAGRKSIPDAGVRDDWYNRGWVPLTENGEGDHHSRSS